MSSFSIFARASRYKIAYGGRGSGKSWAFAKALVRLSFQRKIRVLCARELQASIGDSVIRLLSDTIERMGLLEAFTVERNRIYCNKTGAEFVFYGIKNNPSKIKSLEGVDICWIEEAENITNESLDILIPTIRKPLSEIWMTFNPKNILDPVYQRFVINQPKDSIVEKFNHDANPHFPLELIKEMEECKERDYDLYRHVWLGEPIADSENAVIKPAWIESAIDAHKKLGFESSGKKVCGFDVAGDGKDSNALAFAHGSIVSRVIEWRGDSFAAVHKTHGECSGVVDELVYDSIGVGSHVKGMMEEMNVNYLVNGFNAGGEVSNKKQQYRHGKSNGDMFSNIKAQAWWGLRDRFYNTHLAVTTGKKFNDDELISLSSGIKELEYVCAELSRPRVDYDNNGRVKVESKKDMAKRGIPSPNKADAVIMCFAPKQNFVTPMAW